MSFKPDSDQPFRQFLQTHQPPPPPPSPDLEAQLFQHITQSQREQENSFNLRQSDLGLSWRWLSGGLVLLGMALGGGITWRWQTQTAATVPSAEVLEAFLQESWSGAIAVPEEAVWSNSEHPVLSPTQEWEVLTGSPTASVVD